MTNENDLLQTRKRVQTVEVTRKYLKDLRRSVGLHIDPETAEVYWSYVHAHDPYDDYSNLPEEYQELELEYFARSPGGVWISFGDLPEATFDALWKKRREKADAFWNKYGENRQEDLSDEVPF